MIAKLFNRETSSTKILSNIFGRKICIGKFSILKWYSIIKKLLQFLKNISWKISYDCKIISSKSFPPKYKKSLNFLWEFFSHKILQNQILFLKFPYFIQRNLDRIFYAPKWFLRKQISNNIFMKNLLVQIFWWQILSPEILFETHISKNIP